MKAKLNNQLLKTTTFDSGSLGMLTMVIHQFNTEGHYLAIIMKKGHAVTNIDFYVDKKSDVMQLDIDLAQVVQSVVVRTKNCSHQSELKAIRVVSPKGYVLFHASSGDGYSVLVSNGNGKAIFDSTKLGDGDLFAASLLEPTNYLITNMLGSAKGEIVVSLTSKAAQRIRALETCYIDISEKSIDSKRIELTSSQGLVFRIKGLARILIKKKSSSKVKKGKPKIRWQKPKMNEEKKQSK